jgi:hypothetical protein
LQKISRGPFIAVASSIFLPYGVVTSNTAIETQNQFWLFPFWMYVHDFGNWMGYGRIVPPLLTTTTYPLLVLFLGIIWFAFGFCISMALYRFYSNQMQARLVWLPALSMLTLQICLTTIAAFIIWSGWIVYVIPLPLGALVVLFLLWFEMRRMADEKIFADNSESVR